MEPEFSHKTELGRTGLCISRIGIGSSYGIDSASLEEAYERGINFFYFGTLRTRAMAEAIHHLAPRVRKDLIVAIQSYARWPAFFSKSVEVALRKLKLEYADLLILGKLDRTPSSDLIEKAVQLKTSGKVRFLVVSAHKRSIFGEHVRSGVFDVIMTRYNAAHTGAEREVFPLVNISNRPGVICYTATRWQTLLRGAAGEPSPSACDCYRFVLSHPEVDVCLSGPKNRNELKEAFRVLDSGPMTQEEFAWMRRVGAAVYRQKHHNLLLRKLIFD